MVETEAYQGDQGMAVRKPSPAAADLVSTLKKALFIIGSTTIVFVALRNSLTYHLQHFWGASGDFWQHQWDKILQTFGDDPYFLMVYGSTIVSYFVYWSIGILYTLMDTTNKPAFLRRYKVQPGTNEPVEPWKLVKCILWVHFNQFFVGIPFSIASYYLLALRGYDQSPQLPTFHWVLFELIICILLEEVGFYYSHRLFHHRLLYKHFHKMHHEWQSPIAITAIYAHPLEHICSNLSPVFLGPLVLGSHVATVWLWVSLTILSTLNAHSGYHLPFFPSPEAHDFHHLKFNQCYGVLGVLDLLHGTDDKFRASKCFSRHLMMLSLIPPREAYPDDEPKGKTVKGKQC
ncbi:fatty acid hydroxylase domain-containing protein 2 isoform X3 [Penaeus vannamei]|uniref:Putative fatty acid hydroxylase domain-containing protein 2 n=2 Tax=Penaeus vannamei TaxID=6689 RepID=A0A423TPL8_PENVA|nr:fatty acid hydroxylase domain-containing protein 2-like isoform X2 [Penaeus vannamei]XP_027209693.1 fatty acid hydroxylase domain-containing protein 2-like isoform X2 [Penaeus vannamei]ROT78406.1 putative fatty acid hydroxylase domain-containing protein 2 [Penaeus vannamei]